MTRGNNLDLFPEDIPEDIPEENQKIDNSPSSIAQRERLLRALMAGPVSTFDARARFSILMPATRIFELRKLGHKIISDYRSAEDSGGVLHARIAHYSLIALARNETPSQVVEHSSGCGAKK